MDTIFKEYGISTIIAIDDIFNTINDTEELSMFPPEIIDELTNFERDKYEKYTVREYIEETGETDFISKLQERMSNNDYYSWLNIEGFKSVGADVATVQSVINEIDASDKSKKHLIVLDRELKPTEEGEEHNKIFISILKKIKDSLKEKNLLLLIYTDKPVPVELCTFSGVKDYLMKNFSFESKEAEELALHFNYVNKTVTFSKDFFDNVLKSQKANYVQEYKNIFEESYSKLTERLWELNKNQALFYYDYINEGQHADDIIFDIFLTKFHQVYGKTFGEYAQHAYLVNPIRRSMKSHLSTLSDDVVKGYREEKERILDSSLNFLKIPASSDLTFGDVIQIGEKYFMLLNQDCDIVIRNKGKRKLNYFQLVELSSQSDTSKFKPLPKNLYSIDCIWLDSLSLRKTSNAICLTEDNIKDSHEIRIASSAYLTKKLNEMLTRLDRKSEETVKAIIDFSLSSLNIDCTPIFDNGNLKGFCLKNINRIGRLERLSAMRVLKDVQHDSSRIPDSQSILI
ncbi:TPA: hypothetical protein ACGO2X_001670 [Streptococcus suis]